MTFFAAHGVRYLFIGKSGAILLGFPDPKTSLKNGPFDLDLIFAPDGIEHFEDALAAAHGRRGLSCLPS